MIRRLVCMAAGVLFLGVLTAVPAVAQTGPGYKPGPTLTLSQTTVTVGQTITATGANFAANEDATLTFNSDPIFLTTVHVDGAGGFTTPITIPNVPLGMHTVTATGTTGDSASASLTVVASVPVVTTPAAPGAAPPSAVTPPSAPSAGLAFTGAEISLMALAGAVLLVVGGMLVLTTRKRRSASTS